MGVRESESVWAAVNWFIALGTVCFKSVCWVCVCYRRCVFSWCPEQPVGGGGRQQAGVFWPAEDG